MKLFGSYFPSTKNNRGNAMILVIGGLAILSTAFYFMADSILLSKKRQAITGELLEKQMSLNSVVDYLTYGIRNNYCFSEILTHDSQACDFTHPRSTARLIMGTATEGDLINMMRTGQWVDVVNGVAVPRAKPAGWDSTGIRLEKIEGTIDVESFSNNTHPLYLPLKNILDRNDNVARQIVYSIARNNSVPRSGQEIHLTVDVSIQERTGLKWTTISSVSSKISAHPRELNSFALIGQNLYLSQTKLNPKAGNLNIYPGSNAKTDFGLIFNSPVFLNHYLSVPDNSDHYVPVTFAGKVHLGFGYIAQGPPIKQMINGTEVNIPKGYMPPASNGLGNFWSNMPSMGGMLKGVQIDGKTDSGMDNLAEGGSKQSAVDLNAVCAARNLTLSSRRELSSTILKGSRTSVSADKRAYDFQLGLVGSSDYEGTSGSYNQFVPIPIPRNKFVSWVDPQKVDLYDSNYDKFDEFDHRKWCVATGCDQNRSQMDLNPKLNQYEFDRLWDFFPSGQGNPYDLSGWNSSGFLTSATIGNADQKNAGLVAIIKTSRPGNSFFSQSRKAYAIAHLPTDGTSVTLLMDNAGYGSKFKMTLSSKEMPVATDVSKNHKNRYTFQVNFATTEMASNDERGKDLEISIKLIPFHYGSRKNYVSNYGTLKFRRTSANPSGPSDNSDKNFIFSQIDDTHINGGLPGMATPDWSVKIYKDNQSQYRIFPDLYEFAFPNNPDIDRVCANSALNKPSSQSFGRTSWGFSFADVSYKSWNFANDGAATTVPEAPGAIIGTYNFNEYNSKATVVKTFSEGSRNIKVTVGPSTGVFKVISIAETCVIHPKANFVTGFYTCKNLNILPRTEPLRIIGTFIVINQLNIDPTALSAGIKWSSIYDPDATYELRNAGILRVPMPEGTNTGDLLAIENPIKGWDIIKHVLGSRISSPPQSSFSCGLFILHGFNNYMYLAPQNINTFKNCATNAKVVSAEEADEFANTCVRPLGNTNFLSSTHANYQRLVNCYKAIVAKRPPPYVPEQFQCNDTPVIPAWQTLGSVASSKAVKETERRYYCNVGALRATADPFAWTSIEPDCGVIKIGLTTTSTTMCKREMRNYFVIEHSRIGGF